MKEVEVIKAKGISKIRNSWKTIERLRAAAYCSVSTYKFVREKTFKFWQDFVRITYKGTAKETAAYTTLKIHYK